MPDNITFDGELFWMAALVERDPILDWVHPRSPAFKRLLARLPLRWIPSPVRDSKLSFVVAFDGRQCRPVVVDRRSFDKRAGP